MASAEATPDPVKSKVSVLKVSIHCEGCKKKVFRILRKIEGIELMDVDAKQNKVTVKAPVDAQTLIQKFKKSGKHAELWPEQNISTGQNIAKKEIKEPSKFEEKKENPQKPAMPAAAADTSSLKEAKTEAAKEGENSTGKEPKKADDGSVENAKPPTKSTAAADKTKAAVDVGSTAGGEKTAKKAQHDSNAHPMLAPQPAYIMSYSNAQPSVVQSHYVSPAMPVSQGYMYADQYAPRPPQYADQYAPWAPPPPPPENYYYNAVDGPWAASAHHHQPAADPYSNNMFSDEDPNGCSVM